MVKAVLCDDKTVSAEFEVLTFDTEFKVLIAVPHDKKTFGADFQGTDQEFCVRTMIVGVKFKAVTLGIKKVGAEFELLTENSW